MERGVEPGINTGNMTAWALLCCLFPPEKSTFLVQPDCTLDLCAQYSVLEHLPDGRVNPVRLQFDF